MACYLVKKASYADTINAMALAYCKKMTCLETVRYWHMPNIKVCC